MKRLLVFMLAVVVLVITSCANGEEELANELPLDESRPTLVMFYTDN